ncbi:hypothetical protein [Pseudomonas proteolytica]|uniref:hypothetical protein n=1 Tax=Pseudomonas proteolytica TaxID=219574 RepID=UPI00320B00AE
MHNLQSVFRATVGWCISLGTKIISVAPLATVTIQLASFTAQILLLLTFFLPLKILILLGSDSIPDYFPLYLKNIEKTHLIAGLSALTFLCYILYTSSELIIFHLSKVGAEKLTKKSKKLNLFSNQKKISVQIYSKFNRGLSAGSFSLIALSILLYIYPLFFLAITIYLFLITLLTIKLFNKSQAARNLLTTHYTVALNTLAAIGFLMVFFFMVLNFLYYDPPKVFAALISLLLVRQALSRLTLMIQDIISLRTQHRQVNALFFYSQQLSTELNLPTIKIRTLLDESMRNIWLRDAINSLSPQHQIIHSSSWHQLGNPEIYVFEVTTYSTEFSLKGRFLVKLFSENISIAADQEAALVLATPAIPSLKFFGHTEVENLKCHIFVLDDFKKIERHTAQANALLTNKKLVSIKPPEALALKFGRSHLYLEQRLRLELFEQVRIIALPEQLYTIEKIIEKHSDIIELLSTLPRQIICLDLGPDTLLISENNDIRVSHWANWKMEPVGANWPITHLNELMNAVTEARITRTDFKGITSAAFKVCALAYTFERLCSRANYADAIALLPDLLEQLESNETSTLIRVDLP